MPITFIASAVSPSAYPGSGNNTSTCVIAKPTGTVSGHVMLAFIQTAQLNITAPAGWTLIGSQDDAAGLMRSSCYYRVAGGSEGSTYTWTDDGGSIAPLQGGIATWSGVDTSAVINASASSTTSGTTNKSTPTITTTAAALTIDYRTAKTSTSISSKPTFSSALTNRFQAANRGNSTAYFAGLYTNGNTIVSPGTLPGGAINAQSPWTPITGSVEWHIALTEFGNVPASDTSNPAAEAATVSAIIAGADTGAGVDSAASSNQAGAPDTGTAVDAATVNVTGAIDSGSFDESIKVLSGGSTLAFGTDTAVSAESATVKVSGAVDTVSSTEVAYVGYQGALPPGPRIVRILGTNA